jgi:hypothetical protein
MPSKPLPPDFEQFAKWAASQSRPRPVNADSYERLLTAARATRDEYLRIVEAVGPTAMVKESGHHVEVLQLLAAASVEEVTRPPELTTARGFRVTLAYDDGERPEQSSICVLVQCPPEMLTYVQNHTVYLWNGSQRFELGEFDIDGKAIGTLPAGVQISLSDFASGKITLEEPDYPTQD